MQSCFSKKVEFHLATEPDNLVSLIKKFKYRTRDKINDKSNSVFGEKISIFLTPLLACLRAGPTLASPGFPASCAANLC